MMQVNSNKQTPAIARDREFLVSLKPEAILWQPLFEGAEIAILSGEPNDGRSPHVVRVKHRDGLKVPPHWHSFDENITVVSGRWVGLEFRAGSYVVVPKKVPHFALCRGETIVQGHFVGPIDTTVVRPDDDRRNKTVIAESLRPVLERDF